MRITAAAAVLIVCAVGWPSAAPRTLTFTFQNNFWVNLHHVVRGDARRADLKLPVTVPLESLRPDERTAWSEALAAYADLSKLNLVFDDRLIVISNALSRVTGDTLPDGLVEASVRHALLRAAPIYRTHGWAQQQQLNAAWIAAIRPDAERHAPAMASALAAAYHATWRAEPILIDACAEAGPNNAYTTAGPSGTGGHTVIAVRTPSNSDDSGVETLFHEASHTIDDQIAKPLLEEARRQHVAFPDGLDHALLFFTTGEIMRREFARTGNSDYVPYGDRFDVYRNGWQKFRQALERDWRPYLDGKTTFDVSVTALLRDVNSPTR